MTNIFVSYRHGEIDTVWAGRIEDELKRKQNLSVFRDTSIDIADPFPKRLRIEIEKSDVLIAIIGRDWVESVTRLKSSDDWVRRELEFANELQKPIITIRIERTSIPDTTKLPPELQKLLDLNMASESDSNFKADIDKLSAAVKRLVERQKGRIEWATLNGLRGAMNLAVRHISSVDLSKSSIQDLGNKLVPKLFLEDASDDLNHEQMQVRSDLETSEQEVSQFMQSSPTKIPFKLTILETNSNNTDLHFRGIQYKTLLLPTEMDVEIGVKSNASAIVAVVYEELNVQFEARVTIVIFTSESEFSPAIETEILKLLNEPQAAEPDNYRLPYKSLFICKVTSPTVFRHTYKPTGETRGIDSIQFVTVFDLGWIGSRRIRRDDLPGFHDALQTLLNNVTIIHSFEYERAKTI